MEALGGDFKKYQQTVVANAKTLAEKLTSRGVKLVSGGTDNHLLLMDLSETEVTGKAFEKALGQIGITANKNTVPGEKRSPFVTSGMRLGTPALTTRGLLPAQMNEIGEIIADTLKSLQDEDSEQLKGLSAKVKSLCEAFPLYDMWK